MSTDTQTPAGTAADPFRYGWRWVIQTRPDGRKERVQVPLQKEDLLHPEEDDFIVQTPDHDALCRYLANVCETRLAGRADVLVTHDVRIDWEVEGLRPHGPDVAIFEGLSQRVPGNTGTLLVKQRGARPLMVIEVTSVNTRKNDLNTKVYHYRRAGVPFYAIVDLYSEDEANPIELLAYRNTGEAFLRVELDEQDRLWLEPIRVWLAVEGNQVVCQDEKGERIRGYAELTQAVQQADARAEEAQALTEEAVEARRLAEAGAADAAKSQQAAEKQGKTREDREPT